MVKPPLAPMEAKLVDEIPAGEVWQYEPKWDGFRCIVFRNGDVRLQSKGEQWLTRYFPELVEQFAALGAKQFVLDGEIVIPHGKRLSFDDLLMRIHPAESRIRKLAQETPASFIAFDLLADERGRSFLEQPLRERRKKLEQFVDKYFAESEHLFLSPATTDIRQARRWFRSAGAALDGVIAKRLDFDYRSDDRSGMQKIKPARTVDCVVGGFRYASSGRTLGSLLLGLYDDQGRLNHIGFTSGFKANERAQLLKRLIPLIEPPGFTGRSPGGPSRWSTKRSAEWQPLRPELVVEVEYDHFTGGRFRHGARLVRWRPDKAPRQCTEDQIKTAHADSLALLERHKSRATKGRRAAGVHH